MRRARRPSAHSIKTRDATAHRLAGAGASMSLFRARRKMNPVSGGPQARRFGIGQGGGVRRGPVTGRYDVRKGSWSKAADGRFNGSA